MSMNNRFSKLLTVSLLALSIGGCFARSAPPAPVVNLGAGVDSPAGGMIVHTGDNLYCISKRYNLPIQDIITLNKIAPPYNLYDGQRLKLPAPRKYNVQYRDSLYRISRMFGVSVTDIVRTNNLNAPYHLKSGQELRIPTRSSRRYYYVDDEKVSVRSGAVTNTVEKPQSKPYLAKPQTQTISATSSGQFRWPVRGRVVSSYGPKDKGLHNDGVNISAPRGAGVVSAKSGTVVYTGNALEGFGNLVIIRHENGWVTAYAHLDRISVKRGQTVQTGQSIGTVGSTGRVDSPQLHFEIRRGSEALNPQKYLA